MQPLNVLEQPCARRTGRAALWRMPDLYERPFRQVQEACTDARDGLTLHPDLSIPEGNGEEEVQ
ncbi:hypothetical protein D3C72_2238830 [compost metagenome]